MANTTQPPWVEAVREPTWGQEAGADVAAAMLSRYGRATQQWDLPRTGEFWDAVASAHELGRSGEGCTIAVIDDGFDLSLPALARQKLAWKIDGMESAAHGSVVALLILEVAPAAQLLLYPTANRGAWNAELIEGALREVAGTPATIVNMSLGEAFANESVFAGEEFLRNLAPWPDMSKDDFPFWVAEGFAALNGWRDLVRRPDSVIADAATALAQTGRTVVAASGNASGYVFSPALERDVFSVSFSRVNRAVEGLEEKAIAGPPTFSQSEFSDFDLTQPPHVLGSSFATPLVSGFAALMRARTDLSAYREMRRLAGVAAQLYVQLGDTVRERWSDRRDGVVDKLFKKAVNSQPHPHLSPENYEICPECAAFAVDSYVNFGLFKFNWGDLDGAEELLRPAEAFAPRNPHAAANLALVYARMAATAQLGGRWVEVSRLLERAAALQRKAFDLRPDHEPYRVRAAEFEAGARNPQQWQIQP